MYESVTKVTINSMQILSILWCFKSLFRKVNQSSELIGLLMMGGQSTRMGEDKSQITYRDRPHVDYLFNILMKVLPRTFISVRKGQTCGITDHLIEDKYSSKAPINGILSAMQANPNTAVLVLAVDLPMIQSETIERLIKERDNTKYATAYQTYQKGLPEPLVAIWEPKCFEPLMYQFQVEGNQSLMKFLMQHDTKLIYPESDKELMNANTPEEAKSAKKYLKRHT